MKEKNYYLSYGLGTLGRDMVYALVSMYLIFYLTDIRVVSTGVIWWVTGIMLAARIFDALNDPFMGLIVDNTKSRWGKFKPWMVVGTISSAIFTILLFTNFTNDERLIIVCFAIFYFAWGITYTMHDISYWSMIPSLTKDLSKREKYGSAARICASIGLFAVVAGIVPITDALGGNEHAYFIMAVAVAVIMIIFQAVTWFGVKESNESKFSNSSHTSIKEMIKAIFTNDQLLFAAVSMALFTIGYTTTTSFGLYYFKYVYGDEDMYTIFALILGVSQIVALAIFPSLSRKFSRKKLYAISAILVLIGYVLFFFAPVDTMIVVGIAGVLIFVGEAFIQMLTLMALTDSVEYGEWKFNKRNDAISLSLQPFINKIAGAVASGVVGAIVIISGMKDAQTSTDMTAEGVVILKIAMFIFPLICILIGFFIYHKKYKLDEKMYNQIVEELAERKAKTE